MAEKMSLIEKMIDELCPEGVEWKTLGEVGEFIRGKRFVKNDITSEGVPCIHYGEMYTHYKIWARESKSYLEPTLAARLRNARPGDVIIVAAGETVEDIGGGVAWLGESNVVIHDACFAFSHNLNPKYVSYYLQTDLFRAQIKRYISSGKISSINAAGLSKAKIPIPHLAIQQEIVKILDTFTTLEAELEAELEARKKQYEYYRDELLTFGDDVEWKTMGEVCEMKAGKSISASNISSLRNEDNDYPCVGGNGIRGYVNSFSHSGSFPIIGRQGALCGNVCFAEGEFYATEHAVVVKPGKQFISRFLYHLLFVMNLNQYATGGAQPGLAVSNLKKIKIPIPPLAEQERIVTILDKFDALVNDISVGLPAELNARRKQYEYYRNKLLTFEPLEEDHAKQ